MSDTALDKIINVGTAAARAAFTPSPGTTRQLFIWVDNDSFPSSDPATWVWDSGSSAWIQINASGTGNVTAGGTLTNNALVIGQGTTAVAVTTTGTGILTFLGTPSSANLASAITDETGSGALVFATSPTLVTPLLGTPTSGNLVNCTGYPASSLATISSIYVNLQDQQAQNTNGGTFTSGAWRTRVLNTKVSDVGGLCSLASNQFTLSAGTYLCAASAPGFSCSRHQLRVQNTTDATTLLTGPGNFVSVTGSAESNAIVRGIFTVSASKALELQHQCETTAATSGLGVANNFTTEVFAMVELWKIG